MKNAAVVSSEEIIIVFANQNFTFMVFLISFTIRQFFIRKC